MSRRNKTPRMFVPPRYTIDLSLPPRERYKAIATDYTLQLQSLTGLFDDLLLGFALPPSWLPTVIRFSKLTLRKLRDSEQTEELRGIADVTNIDMYLLIAFNTVLDLLMGCTSGGVRIHEDTQSKSQTTMLHFRTMDWTMDPLRWVTVQLDFVRSKSKTPTKVIASSITYVGFVGVLTGVKQGLSISLNFRAVHNANTKVAHFRFYFHHLLVLFGRRHSIAGYLRQYLLEDTTSKHKVPTTPAGVASNLQSKHTTSAYIILCDGQNTITMEKDYATAKIRSSDTFIAITNHDKEEHDGDQHPVPLAESTNRPVITQNSGLQDIIEESKERLCCIQDKWNAKLDRAQNRNQRTTRSQSANDKAVHDVYMSKTELIKWISDFPTTNECTHYAAILDPNNGEVAWAQAYPDPIRQ